MWHRSFAVVVLLLAVLCVILFAGAAEAQTTTQQHSSSSQQQLKPQPTQTMIKQVKPVGPVSPVKSDLKIDTSAGSIAAAGATELMVIDLQGDGLDLGGRAKIRIGGSTIDTNWTRLNTEDAFLVLDAARLRDMGFELRDANGVAVQSRILVSDGLNLRAPDGTELSVNDSWQLLSQFDANKDGKINSRDPNWQNLSLFVDANADGTMGDEELTSVAGSTVREISLVEGPARTDAGGNRLTDGTFTRGNGTTGSLAGVKLRRY